MCKSNMSSSFLRKMLSKCVRTQVAGTAVPTSLPPFCAPPVLPRLQRRTAAWQRCFTGAFLAGPWNLHFGTAPRPWTKWGAGGRGTWQLKNRNCINFELRWRQARLALSSRLPTSRTWSDRKIDRTFRTWHWHNLSLLAPVLHLLLSIPGCKLLPFCHLVRHDGSTANPENPKPRPPPSHWAQSAGVVPSRAGTWTCIKLLLTRLELKVSKVRRLRNATPGKKKKKAKSWAPNCTFSLESTGAGNLGLGLTQKQREVSNRKLEISRTLRTLRVHLAFLRLKALMNGLGVSSRKDGKLRPLQFAEVEA